MITGGVGGVDYAFPPRPSIAALVAAGKKFAARYGGPGTSDKWLDQAEARALCAAGLTIVANAEGSASGLLSGFDVGATWAKQAEAWFRGIGMPPDRPIYFSLDVNCTSTQWPAAREGLRGCASIIGLNRVGLYGHYNAMRWARQDNVARWFWQTYAWSGGNWAAGNHMEQYLNGAYIGGVQVDLNRAIPGDFGQWIVGGGSARNVFSQKQAIIAPDPATGEIYPSTGAATKLMQIRLNKLPEVTPKLKEDGQHGPLSAVGLSQGLGGADGTYYGPAQVEQIDSRLRAISGGSAVLVPHTHPFDAPAGTSGPAVAV